MARVNDATWSSAGKAEDEVGMLRKQLATMKQQLIDAALQNEEEQACLIQVIKANAFAKAS